VAKPEATQGVVCNGAGLFISGQNSLLGADRTRRMTDLGAPDVVNPIVRLWISAIQDSRYSRMFHVAPVLIFVLSVIALAIVAQLGNKTKGDLFRRSMALYVGKDTSAPAPRETVGKALEEAKRLIEEGDFDSAVNVLQEDAHTAGIHLDEAQLKIDLEERLRREIIRQKKGHTETVRPLGKPTARPKAKTTKSDISDYSRLGMQVIVSLVILGGALFIILSERYDPKDKHWAYGSVGTILGFWLKK
jgi:hypothetical protein